MSAPRTAAEVQEWNGLSLAQELRARASKYRKAVRND